MPLSRGQSGCLRPDGRNGCFCSAVAGRGNPDGPPRGDGARTARRCHGRSWSTRNRDTSFERLTHQSRRRGGARDRLPGPWIDRTRAQALGACARETIEEAFSQETNGRAVVDTYQEVVQPRGRSPQADRTTWIPGRCAGNWREGSLPTDGGGSAIQWRRRSNDDG